MPVVWRVVDDLIPNVSYIHDFLGFIKIMKDLNEKAVRQTGFILNTRQALFWSSQREHTYCSYQNTKTGNLQKSNKRSKTNQLSGVNQN